MRPLRKDETAIAAPVAVLLFAIALVLSSLAATGNLGRLVGQAPPSGAPTGSDADYVRRVLGELLPVFPDQGTTPEAQREAALFQGGADIPTEEPVVLPPTGGGGGGGGVKRQIGPSPISDIDWALLALGGTLGLIAVANIGGRKIRLRKQAVAIVMILVLVSAAAFVLFAPGLDLNGDGDVDDSAFMETGELAFSVVGALAFDGTIGYADGSSEDLHQEGVLAVMRDTRVVLSLAMRVSVVARCGNCSVEVVGGFAELTASRPDSHPQGGFLRSSSRRTFTPALLEQERSFDLYRVALDAASLQTAFADADGVGTAFVSVVGALELGVFNATHRQSLRSEFSWPSMEFRLVTPTEPIEFGCVRLICPISLGIVQAPRVRFWLLAALPTGGEQILRDLGML